MWSRGKVTVYRYRSDQVRLGPPLLLFVGLVSRPYFMDLRPGNSFVERLIEAGFDVFLLDWGHPDTAEGDHVAFAGPAFLQFLARLRAGQRAHDQ